MSAFEKLSTRARELLGEEPRMSTDDIADTMLREIWNEQLSRVEFVQRMRPAMRHIVQTTASRMRMSMLDEASAAYLARPVDPQALEELRHATSETQGSRAQLPERAAERAVDHPGDEAQRALVSPPVPQSAGQPGRETQDARADALQDDGQPDTEAQRVPAVPAERGADQIPSATQSLAVSAPALQADQGKADSQSGSVGLRNGNGGGQVMPEAREARAAPVTPQSLRNEVLPGWRSLVNEPLFVPETDGLTYGSATREHWTRRLQWHHDQAKGHLDTARKERLILQELEASDAGCLNDLLDGRAS